VSSLLGVAFGNRDLQTLPLHISIYGLFLKERIFSNNRQSFEELKLNIEKTVKTLTQKHLPKSSKTHHMGEILSSRRYWTYSASAVKLFSKSFLTIKNKEKNSSVLLYWSSKLTNALVVRIAF
jgi:hypothetical protein